MPKLTQGFKDGDMRWFEGDLPKDWSRQPTEEKEPNEGTNDWYKMKLTEFNIEFNPDAVKAELKKLYDAQVDAD